jgi:hypothetical protein
VIGDESRSWRSENPITIRRSHDHESILSDVSDERPTLGREFNGLFVPENANGLLELLGVERFL